MEVQRQDFWHDKEAESMGVIPTGGRVGQFLFLSAQTPIDMETGRLIRDFVDLPAEVRGKVATPHHLINAYFGPVMAQTWTIYQNLSSILERQGASLKDIIRQRIFLRDTRDSGWMEKVMLSFFPGEKPATLILGVPDRGLHGDIRVWVDIIALIPQKGGLTKEHIRLSELEKVTAPYPQGVKVGQLLFFDGLRGVDPESGHPVRSFDELEDEARSGLKGLYVDTASEPMKCQFWLAYNGHIRRLLESQGAELKDLLDVTGFWRHGMRDLGEREYLREKLFKTAQASPPSTAFGVYGLSVIAEVELVTGGVALLPGKSRKQALRYGTTDKVGTYSALTKGGSFWFHAGMMGVDLAGQRSITSFGDLADSGRFLAQNCIDDKQSIMAKAWYIYSYMLDGVEAKAGQVVHQTIYLTDLSDWSAVEKVANIVFKGRIPPTTIVPVDEISFNWLYHESTLPVRPEPIEIQLWGLME